MNDFFTMLVSSCVTASAACMGGGAIASPAMNDAQILVQIHVFDQWPNHPKLKFDMKQQHVDAPTPPETPESPKVPARPESPEVHESPPAAHQMSAEEFAVFMAEVVEAQGEREPFLASARILVNSGQTASVRIGADDANGKPLDGMHAVMTPHLRADGKIDVAFSYEAFGLEVQSPASRFENGDQIGIRNHITLALGDTEFMVATGYIGAPMHLISFTARVIDSHAGE